MGGVGLARGYHRRPGLTAERFVPDPFGEEPGGRLYRTGISGGGERMGDRVRRTRGSSGEDPRLSDRAREIEAELVGHPGVHEAVVVVRGDHGSQRLVGYVVTSEGASAIEEIKSALRRALPDYMVPSEILALEEMPRTPNGKIDRRRLPEPERVNVNEEYVEPRTEVEKKLAAIWRDVLGVPRVGTTDNFFDLGGHSLLAIALISRINAVVERRVTLPQLLQSPTVASLARIVEEPSSASSILVPLNRSAGSSPALFCVHPAGGVVFAYQSLAQRLADRRPVYGVLCRTFVDPSWLDGSIQEMAASYAEAVMEAQPTGPCFLLGWSSAGPSPWRWRTSSREPGARSRFWGSSIPMFQGSRAATMTTRSLTKPTWISSA